MHRGMYMIGHPWARELLVLVLLALLAAAVVAVIVLATRLRPGHQGVAVAAPRATPAAGTEATRILDERYARGEIDDEEYQRRRAVLRSSSST